MKWKVIGWTYYDCPLYKEGENTQAVVETISDEIKNKGYLFTGWHHQESNGCVPIMNDGKMRIFSSRSFGSIMAHAYNKNGMYDYSLFSDCIRTSNNFKTPKNDYLLDDSLWTKKLSSLNEEFTLEDDSIDLSKLKETLILKREFKFHDDPYRFLDRNDTLIVKSKGKQKKFKVKNIEVERVLSKENYKVLNDYSISLYKHPENKDKRDEYYQSIPIIQTIYLK